MKPKFEEYHQIVEQLIQAALDAADPRAAVTRHLKREGRRLHVANHEFALDRGNVYLVSIGKAALSMGLAAAEVVAEELRAGIIVSKAGEGSGEVHPDELPTGVDASKLRFFQGGHPLSNEESVQAAIAVTELLADTKAEDLVLCLISGGASAIHAYPQIPLADWRALNQALLQSGCTINELNQVRRPLDRVKGGGLARYAAPAACISLILSDVIGNPLEVIGSGPTVLIHDRSEDALRVMDQYGIASRLDVAIWKRIAGFLEHGDELPKPGPDILHNVIVGDVRQSAEAAMIHGAKLGFVTQVLTTRLQGEAREVGRVVAAIAKDLAPGRCLILGGETTVTVRGQGEGGRNQELALAAAIELDGWPNTAIACFTTDGEDGVTDAAGAVVTGGTVPSSRKYKLDARGYLDENDSHTYFFVLDSMVSRAEAEKRMLPDDFHLVRTGPTGTNVNDLIFILSFPEQAEAVRRHGLGSVLEYTEVG